MRGGDLAGSRREDRSGAGPARADCPAAGGGRSSERADSPPGSAWSRREGRRRRSPRGYSSGRAAHVVGRLYQGGPLKPALRERQGHGTIAIRSSRAQSGGRDPGISTTWNFRDPGISMPPELPSLCRASGNSPPVCREVGIRRDPMRSRGADGARRLRASRVHGFLQAPRPSPLRRPARPLPPQPRASSRSS
jgi:hypothetical protein